MSPRRVRVTGRPAAAFFLLAWIFAAAAIGAETAELPATLSTAAQVRALKLDEARRAIPARLHGVVVGRADPEGIAFVMQDDTEGIYVQGPPDLVSGLASGDLVEIEGVTDPGGFAPYVAASSIRKLGRAAIPEPVVVTLDELNAGQMDAKWVEFSGIVRSIERKAPTDVAPPPPGTRYAAPTAPVRAGEGKVKLKLAAGSARVVVEVPGPLNAEDTIDGEVRLRGLCFNLHNHNRQFVRPFVQVQRRDDLVVERPPPSDPFGGAVRPVASLLQFDQLTGERAHRVHVRGVVVHHRPGTALWVRDGGRSLRVATSQPGVLQPGDEVDVLGFPAQGEYSAVLEDAVFRKRGDRTAPEPHVLEDVSAALQNDADLVQIVARLSDVQRSPDAISLTLDWRGTPVRAQLLLRGADRLRPRWQRGSVVRVAGICSVITEEAGPLGGLWEPRSFQLLLRSPGDLVVVQPPPWWTPERIVYVLAAFLALAAATVAAVMLASRRRLRDQERRRAMAETEFAAILNERNRVAREIHDTLSQSLGAISVQLELARTHADDMGVGARNHLGLAHKLTRAALAEARESIWNMRSHVLEKCDLSDALQDILRQMTDGGATVSSFQIEGTRRRLPPVVENNLLRIGQEAITNACKHAKPTKIDVKLVFERRTVRLEVRDDGIGFDGATRPSAEQKSFGLVGISERAELLGGKVEIKSAPGQGTQVIATVSV